MISGAVSELADCKSRTRYKLARYDRRLGISWLGLTAD